QSLFEQLKRRNEHCEILCIPNGCTDRTVAVAEAVFAREQERHPFAEVFSCRTEEVEQAGRNHTWNLFVHSLSAPEARVLFLMDADIMLNHRDTLFNMYQALLNHGQAYAAGDRQYKDISFKKRKSLLDQISLATSDMTRTIDGQITW